MKRQWWITASTTAVLALTCTMAMAQGNSGKDRDEPGLNHGQSKKADRQFDDRQRQYARNYYEHNRHQEVFRQDNRWNDDYDRRLRPGYVMDDDMRRMSRPAPYEMTRGMGRPPRGYRYVIIGGHVILIDDSYRVHDAIHFEINLGH